MEKKLRHLLSFTAICAFIIMAMGSFGPDSSTHLEVLGSACAPDDQITVNPQLEVVILDDSDEPINDQPFTVFTTQEKILEDCVYFSTFQRYSGLATDASGMSQTDLLYMVQNNHGDLIRVEVKVDETINYSGARVVKVLPYGEEIVDFLIILKDKSVL